MKSYLIKNAAVVNEGKTTNQDVLIKNARIERVDNIIDSPLNVTEINAEGLHLLPGVIDDQVHFREPGLTHKAQIATESKAAVAGGTTGFMEMPNTVPNALTQEILEKKYQIASGDSWANYSFFMGGSNDNFEEAMKTDLKNVCGLKLFMGSSTGNMLVDDETSLNRFFGNFEGLIATHCEDEKRVRTNNNLYKEKYSNGELPFDIHAAIRDVDACYISSSHAVELAKKHGTRLHILHISTAKELDLFDNSIPLIEKKITAEVCVHHLYFDAEDYKKYGTQIKCNPAVKHDQKEGLWQGLLDDRLDVIATDHAPHTREEKSKSYWDAPSGIPLVQHSLQMMLDFYKEGKISLEKVVEKMSHAPAELFRIENRGFIREGYWADLVLVDLNKPFMVKPENLYYKCAWSPFMGKTFGSTIMKTFVSGELKFDEDKFFFENAGKRMEFRSL